MNDGVQDIALGEDQAHAVCKADYEGNECHAGQALTELITDLIEGEAADKAAGDRGNQTHSNHQLEGQGGIAGDHRVTNHYNILHQVDDEDQDGAAGELYFLEHSSFFSGNIASLIGTPALAPHGGESGVLADLLDIAQQEEQTSQHEDVHGDEHGKEGAVDLYAHQHLGSSLLGGAGTETDEGSIGRNAHSADGVELELLSEHNADGNDGDEGIGTTECAQVNHQAEHNANENGVVLILELVNSPVHELIECAGAHNDSNGSTGNHNGPTDQRRVYKTINQQQEYLQGTNRGLGAQILELVTEDLTGFGVGHELTGGDHIGQQTAHEQQADHDPEQVRHLKALFHLFRLFGCSSH